MNIFAKFLAPKNKVFYELFEKSADNVKNMGALLLQVVQEPDFDKRQSLISKMEDVEHANDELTHTLFTELGRRYTAGVVLCKQFLPLFIAAFFHKASD